MIYLPNVTLIALTGIGYRTDQHLKAIEQCCKNVKFGAVKLIQDSKITDLDSYSHEMIYSLGKYVDTEFAMTFQDHAFIVNPFNWNPEWLQYDYIGSPFPLPSDDVSFKDVNGVVQRVGNGGFSLRSKRLIDLASALNLEWKAFHGHYNEDGFICVNNRYVYEQHGMKFASLKEAVKFSREYDMTENEGIEPFAFHLNKTNFGKNAEFINQYNWIL